MRITLVVHGFVAVWFLALTTASGEDYLQHLLELPDNTQRIAYVESLDCDAALVLASQAIEAGWDEYAVGVGILSPMWEKKPPSYKDLRDVITNQNFHPRLRCEIGMGGFAYADRWDIETALQYVDDFLVLLEDPHIPYQEKQGMAGRLCRFTYSMAQLWSKDGGDNKQAAIERLVLRDKQLIDYLTRLVDSALNIPGVDERAPDAICADLVECVGWCLEKPLHEAEASQVLVKSCREGQKALIKVLTNSEYAGSAARLVLRRSEQVRLSEVITKEDVNRIKEDNRFSNEEDRRLISVISENVRSEE